MTQGVRVVTKHGTMEGGWEKGCDCNICYAAKVKDLKKNGPTTAAGLRARAR